MRLHQAAELAFPSPNPQPILGAALPTADPEQTPTTCPPLITLAQHTFARSACDAPQSLAFTQAPVTNCLFCWFPLPASRLASGRVPAAAAAAGVAAPAAADALTTDVTKELAAAAGCAGAAAAFPLGMTPPAKELAGQTCGSLATFLPASPKPQLCLPACVVAPHPEQMPMVAPPVWGRKAQHAMLPLAPQSREDRHCEPMLDWCWPLPTLEAPLGSGVRAKTRRVKRRSSVSEGAILGDNDLNMVFWCPNVWK